MAESSSVKTVDRLVCVLDSFTSERLAWSLADLSARLDLPKSTLHRFLVSLEAHGILRRDPDDKLWRLGYRIIVWGGLAASSTTLRDIARPVMRDLMTATGETAALTIYERGEVICIEKVETTHPVRMTLEVGARRHPHAGASSKILMAYLPPEEVEAIIRKGLPRLCTNTISDRDELLAELQRIREQGYALSREETDYGAWGVATPICDCESEIVGAIGVAGPLSRFSDNLAQEYVELCRQASHRVCSLLNPRLET